MKKKLLLTLLALVCALCCALGLAACGGGGGGDKVTCTITSIPQHVSVRVDGDIIPPVKQLDKGTEYVFTLYFDRYYDIGSLKMYIDGTEMTFERNSEDGSTYYWYDCLYTPTADFTISFSGEPEFLVNIDEFIFEPEFLELRVGDTEYVFAVAYAEGYDGDVPVSVVSNNPGVAKVEHEGGAEYRVTGISAGETTLTATAGDMTMTCYVVVQPPVEIESVTLSSTEMTLEVGYEDYFRVTVYPDEYVQIDVTSANPEIATVEYSYHYGYVVTGVSVGSTTITVTAGGKSATCTVTVKEPPTQSNGSAGLEYTLNNDGKYVVSGLGECTETDIVIANYYEGVRVVGIRSGAFADCTSITSVTIPDGIYEISRDAFARCSSLERVVIGDDVTTISYAAFEYCFALTDIVLGSSVKSIDSGAFPFNSFNIYIKDLAQWCGIDSLRRLRNSPECRLFVNEQEVVGELVIPEGVKSISSYAFSYFTGITSVVIPASVESIGASAFDGCSNLAEIHVSSLSQWLSFEDIRSIKVNSNISLYIGGQLLTGDVVIPDGVTAIPDYAFSNTSITNVTISDSVTSIGEYAFYHCDYLLNVNMGNSVTSIGEFAFQYCSSIQSIDLSNVQTIGRYAFSGCRSLASVTSNGKITSIGYWAFENCEDLVTLDLGGSAVNIDSGAFYYCTKLETANLEGAISIGNQAFYRCQSLVSVTLGEGLESIGDSAFAQCESLANITLPNSLLTLGVGAFEYCGLTSITIPAGITTIEMNAFSHCAMLASVTFNGTITSIGLGAFQNCGFTSINLSEGLLSIGPNAFMSCYALTEITIPSSVTSIGYGAFTYCHELTIVHWNAVSSEMMDYGDYYVSGYAEGVFADDTLLTAIVTGSNVKNLPTALFVDSYYLETITLNEGLESIGDIRKLPNLTSLNIPSTVTQIGDISDCAILAEITFPDNLDISHVTFSNCPNFKGSLLGDFYLIGTKLTGVKEGVTTAIIPSNVTTIASGAFSNAASVKYVYIPDSVTAVESGAFTGCTAYVFVGGYGPSGLSGQAAKIEYDMGDITTDGWIYKSNSDGVQIMAYIGAGGEVAVPAQIDGRDVNEIGNGSTAIRTFIQRDDITKLTFTSTLVSINEWAIANCTNLEEIVIGANVISFNIPKKAIEGCSNLTKITLEGGFENYQMYIVTMTGTSIITTLTDGADLLNRVKNSADGSACMIMQKGMLPQ